MGVLVVVLATLCAFSPALQNDFVDWDDQPVLVDNTRYLGLGPEHLGWMFTTGFSGHYQPLTWLSFALESRLWGVSATGYHATNLVLHIGVAVSFFFLAVGVLRRSMRWPCCSGLAIGASVAALAFAVHPLRVESVAWATERRDVLSGFWLMLTVLAYMRASELPLKGRWYGWIALSLVCYTASLLSKAWGITLPVVLLILDVYPLRRTMHDDKTGMSCGWLRILGEKVLFGVPAIVTAWLAVWAQQGSGAFRTLSEHGLGVRIGQAVYGLVFYLQKTIWPTGLVPLYEQPADASAWEPRHVVAGVVVLIITVGAIAVRRRYPALLACWLVYGVVVSPVLGLAQSGPQVVADRYSYLACMVWALLLGGFVARLWGDDRAGASPASSGRRTPIMVASVVVAFVLVTATRDQTRIWRDSRTLWTTTLSRAPDTPMAHVHLAALDAAAGDFVAAVDHARRALARLPGNLSAHQVLGSSALELGDLDTAVIHLRIAIDGYRAMGRPDPGLIVGLAVAKTRLGAWDEAERLYRQAVEKGAGDARFPFCLGSFLASQDRLAEAVGYLEKAVALAPTYHEARYRLATVLSKLGRDAEAAQTLEGGMSLGMRDVPQMVARLAWLLSTSRDDRVRNGPRALQLAQEAVSATRGRDVKAKEALAAALAESGNFDEAVATLRHFLATHAADIDPTTRARLIDAIEVYSSHKPFRE